MRVAPLALIRQADVSNLFRERIAREKGKSIAASREN